MNTSIISTISFFLSEAWTNIKRAGVMTFITISTIGIGLLMMGAFLLASMNMEAFLAKLQAEALVTAFILPQTPIDTLQKMQGQITAFPEISEITLVTPEEAANELFQNPEDRSLLEIGLAEQGNPLPHTFRMRIRSGADLKPLLKKLSAFPAIESVNYGEEVFRQFQGLSEILWVGSLLVIVFLGLASLFIVFNTIRLTLFMRREEIIIMRLVGATNWFIRWPFICEGMIQGMLGSVLAIAMLVLCYNFFLLRLAAIIPFFRFEVGWVMLSKLSFKLFMMGIILGVTGSLLSLRDLRSFSRSA
jgi:cell division transport system permease protein